MHRDVDNPLGRTVAAPARYDPAILFPIPRTEGRAQLDLTGDLSFAGFDRWLCWELSWLDARGMPDVAVLELVVPADSPAMVESKSLKLYLQSMNQTPMGDRGAVAARIAADLETVTGGAVTAELHDIDAPGLQRSLPWQGRGIDAMNPAQIPEGPDSALLSASDEQVSEVLYSHRFRSLCPVTGQPDWATVTVGYCGRKLDASTLLAYLLGFREHAAYHEQCVEQIWRDLHACCEPEQLDVSANFLRRGGIDINPRRYSGEPVLTCAISSRQ